MIRIVAIEPNVRVEAELRHHSAAISSIDMSHDGECKAGLFIAAVKEFAPHGLLTPFLSMNRQGLRFGKC
jgi:hypothetical protein